jgi:hypothetical protein
MGRCRNLETALVPNFTRPRAVPSTPFMLIPSTLRTQLHASKRGLSFRTLCCGLLLPTAEFVCHTATNSWHVGALPVRCACSRGAPQGTSTSITILRVPAHTELPALLLSESISGWPSRSTSMNRRFRSIANGWQIGVPRLVNYGPGHPGNWLRWEGLEPSASGL